MWPSKALWKFVKFESFVSLPLHSGSTHTYMTVVFTHACYRYQDTLVRVFSFGVSTACLAYIAQALQRDPGYVKGLALMQRIYADIPYMQRDTMYLFHQWFVKLFYLSHCAYRTRCNFSIETNRGTKIYLCHHAFAWLFLVTPVSMTPSSKRKKLKRYD